jgi:hypothetical protein
MDLLHDLVKLLHTLSILSHLEQALGPVQVDLYQFTILDQLTQLAGNFLGNQGLSQRLVHGEWTFRLCLDLGKLEQTLAESFHLE